MQELGFDAYLTKPVKQSVLRDALLTVLAPERRTEPRPSLLTAHGISEAARARRRVLVVDDNPLNCRIAAQAVERAGFSCETLSRGEEALTATAQGRYDMVFLDCQMPGLDGYETARRIRGMEGADRRTPIVALTAEGKETWLRHGPPAGFDDHLQKPARAEEYEAMLLRWTDPRTRRTGGDRAVRLVVDNETRAASAGGQGGETE
jgi:CheY-like chemotaxis protein